MSSLGSSAWREEFWGPGCDPSVLVTGYWIAGAGKIQCHRNALRAFRALGRVFQLHGYGVRSDVTGCYNCRPITGGTAPSAHSQGIALDANWDTNPYRKDKLVTDMPEDMVADALALKTTAGDRAFRWGGDWDGRPETPHSNYDAMHWEVILTPAQMRAGFLVSSFPTANRRYWPLLALNEKGPGVKQLQVELNVALDLDPRLDLDGYFGPKTETAVKAFQFSRKLDMDGVVGLGTWTAIFTEQPEAAEMDPSPHKG